MIFYEKSGVAHRAPARLSLSATALSVPHDSRTFRALPRPAEWMTSRDMCPWPMFDSDATLAETETV